MTSEEAQKIKIGDEAWAAEGCFVVKVRILTITKKTKHKITSEIFATVIQNIYAPHTKIGDGILIWDSRTNGLDNIFRMGTDDRLLIKEIFKQ